MTRVSVSNLHKHFPNRAADAVVHRKGAINGLDLDIEDGEFFVLLGPSGCGKTTTLRCISGLETPTSGAISIGDALVYDSATARSTPPHKRDLGMMFQSYALWPHMTVGDNIAYPLKQRRRFTNSEIARRVAQQLDLVGLQGLAHAFPHQLSGGQQQRVALARAIVASPRLVLFDEPLSNLDAQLRARLRIDLRRVHDETRSTSIYVTHDQSEAFALADRIAILRAGRVEQIGAPHDIYRKPASQFVAEFIGYENVLPGLLTRGGRFQAEGLPAPLATPAPASLSGKGVAAIRANALDVSFTRPTNDAIAGFLESVVYLGDRHIARVKAGSVVLTGTLAADAWAPGRSVAGNPVFITAAASDVVFIPEHVTEAAHSLEAVA